MLASILIGLASPVTGLAQALKEGPQQKRLAPRPLPPAARSEEAQLYSVTREAPQMVTPGFARMKEASSLMRQDLPAAGTGRSGPPHSEFVSPRSQLSREATSMKTLPTYLSGLYPSPAVVDFGSMLIGQRQSRFVSVIAPADGTLTASVTDTNLRVQQFLSFNGRVNIVQGAARGRSAGQNPLLLTRVEALTDSQGSGTQPQIKVNAGQDVAMIVEFNPLRARGVGLGLFRSVLRLEHSNGKIVEVPIQARLDGTLEGIDIDFGVPALAVSGSDFAVPFTWYNDGESSSATLSFGALSPGLSGVSPPQTVTLAKGQRVSSELIVHASEALLPPGSQGQIRTFVVQLVNGSTRLAYGVDVDVISPWLTQSIYARYRFSDGDEVYLVGMLQIRSDGWFEFSGNFTGDDLCANTSSRYYEYTGNVSLPGGFVTPLSGSFGHDPDRTFGTCNSTWDKSGTDVHLAGANFAVAAAGLNQVNPSLRVRRTTF